MPDIDDIWDDEEDRATYTKRAAPTASPAASTEALTDERDLSKALMDLLKRMHEAPTTDDGYDLLADFTAQAGLGMPVALKSKQPAADRIGCIPLPQNLHPDTVKMVCAFAAALAARLALSENKPRRGDYWQRTDWRDELVMELQRHVTKGDPLDVAAYCAFAWHHQWSIAPASLKGGAEALTETAKQIAWAFHDRLLSIGGLQTPDGLWADSAIMTEDDKAAWIAAARAATAAPADTPELVEALANWWMSDAPFDERLTRTSLVKPVCWDLSDEGKVVLDRHYAAIRARGEG